MFVSFTKTLKKMSGFRLGFGVRVNKRNAPLWCFAKRVHPLCARLRSIFNLPPSVSNPP